PFSTEDVVRLAAHASHTENPDAIDTSVIGAIGDPARALASSFLTSSLSTSSTSVRRSSTARSLSDELKRVTTGLTGIIIGLCTPNKTEEIENRLRPTLRSSPRVASVPSRLRTRRLMVTISRVRITA
ncbi:hypothetical protein C8Q76DRAFT_810178, partial [Earliella scabrosa]